jgi:hypothetical protein
VISWLGWIYPTNIILNPMSFAISCFVLRVQEPANISIELFNSSTITGIQIPVTIKNDTALCSPFSPPNHASEVTVAIDNVLGLR